MKFLCGGCQTKYQISDEKVRGKILTIRCQKCGAKILVRESAAEVAKEVPAAQAAPDKVEVTVKEKVALAGGRARPSIAPGLAGAEIHRDEDVPTSIAQPPRLDLSEIEWFTATNGVQSGPFTLAEVVRKITSREIDGNYYAWHQNMGAWTRIREVAELAPHLPRPAAPPPLPPSGPGADVVDFSAKLAERDRTKRVESSSIVPRRAKPAPGEDKWSAQTEAAIGRPVSSRHEPLTPDPSAGRRKERVPTPVPASVPVAPLTSGAPLTPAARARSLPPAVPPKSTPAMPLLDAATPAWVADSTSPERPAHRNSLSTPAGMPLGGGSAADLDFSHKDDIFANIPRIDAEPTRLKESTRFFVAAAGIQERHKRNRMGLMIGLSGVFAVLTFLGAWAGGLIQIDFERMKDPFGFSSASNEEDGEEYEEVLDEDADGVREALEGDKRKRRRKRRVPAAEHRAQQESRTGTRGDETPETLSFDKMGQSKLEVKIPEAKLPESDVDSFQPPVDHPELSAEAVRQVVDSRKRSVAICYQTSLKGNTNVRGKMELLVTVKPSGDVAKVSVVKSAAGGGPLGECIAEKIRDWKFPSFQGTQPTEVRVPFVLAKEM